MAPQTGAGNRNEALRSRMLAPLRAEFVRSGGKLIRVKMSPIGVGLLCDGEAHGKPLLLPITSNEIVAARGNVAKLCAIVRERLAQVQKLREAEKADESSGNHG